MSAKFGSFSAPADEALAVTESDDAADNFLPTRGLYVGGTGNVTVVMAGPAGNTVQFVGVPTGFILPISCVRVTTATTATSIVALR